MERFFSFLDPIHTQDADNTHCKMQRPLLQPVSANGGLIIHCGYNSVLFTIRWNVNLAYVGLMLNTGSLFGSIYLNMALGGLLEILGYIAAEYLMGRKWLGRRFVLSAAFILCGVALLCTLAVPEGKQTAHNF